jgi:hypothetical protein
MDVMEKNHGGSECTGFLMKDLYNFFRGTRSKELKAGMQRVS